MHYFRHDDSAPKSVDLKAATLVEPRAPTAGELRARALIRAAEIIEERGWSRGHLGIKTRGFFGRILFGHRPVCLLGAVYLAGREVGIKNRGSSAEVYAASIIRGEGYYIPAGLMWQWNDTLHRSERNVVTKFLRRVAQKPYTDMWDFRR